MKKPLFIFTNGPGEVSTWVSPFLHYLNDNQIEASVYIYLTPCQFSTGNEKNICENLPQVVRVMEPNSSIRMAFSISLSKTLRAFMDEADYLQLNTGSVLFLGGDPWYARIFGLRLGLPRFAYSQSPSFPKFGYKHVFYRQKDGDLMNDSIQQYLEGRSDLKGSSGVSDTTHESGSKKSIDILIFCGSRPNHFKIVSTLIAESLDYYFKQNPSSTLTFCLGVSPFISKAAIEQLKQRFPSVFSNKQVIIKQERSLALLKQSKTLVTIPGSNTAEAMYMGVPQLVVIPLNNPEELIFNGLLGLICKLPIVGKAFSTGVLKLIASLNKRHALPNIISQSEAVPEKAAVYTASLLSQTILDFYNNSTIQDQQLETLRRFRTTRLVSRAMAKKMGL